VMERIARREEARQRDEAARPNILRKKNRKHTQKIVSLR
jgi:hypothetical protein